MADKLITLTVKPSVLADLELTYHTDAIDHMVTDGFGMRLYVRNMDHDHLELLREILLPRLVYTHKILELCHSGLVEIITFKPEHKQTESWRRGL